MRFFPVFVLFAVFCLSAGAFAAIEGFPNTLEFYNAPLKIDFNISNPSDSEKRVAVEFLSPLDANIAAPLKIPAKGTASAAITLVPKLELVGQKYYSTLIVRVGENETRKTVQLVFNAAPAGISGFSGLVGFFSNPNAELALDIVLAIVAVVLLIAFISRLVKRFSVKT